MSYQDLIYRVEEGIATITLNRPERMNTFSPNLEAELHAAFHDNEPADDSMDKVVRDATESKLARGNYICSKGRPRP